MCAGPCVPMCAKPQAGVSCNPTAACDCRDMVLLRQAVRVPCKLLAATAWSATATVSGRACGSRMCSCPAAPHCMPHGSMHAARMHARCITPTTTGPEWTCGHRGNPIVGNGVNYLFEATMTGEPGIYFSPNTKGERVGAGVADWFFLKRAGEGLQSCVWQTMAQGQSAPPTGQQTITGHGAVRLWV